MNTEKTSATDLQAQLDGLFDTVWLCERQWEIDEHIDLILGNNWR